MAASRPSSPSATVNSVRIGPQRSPPVTIEKLPPLRRRLPASRFGHADHRHAGDFLQRQ
jgi:hypothetical protein